MSHMPHLIEFLIPAYKRFDGVAAAALSVAKQVAENGYEGIVKITVVDDASPGFNRERLVALLGNAAGLVGIESNITNKGMSQNIFDMVSGSNAEFCSVLTDDDWLIDGKLEEIIEYLQSIVNNKEFGGLFTPRYSYLESGELHCIVCKAFSTDNVIASGPASAMKHCANGFILTGFIFRPAYLARKEWSENIENGYFPIINFGLILFKYSILFIDRNWFHHTVLNVCHWESWGEDQLSQATRLYRDYMDAIGFLANTFESEDTPLSSKVLVIWYEFVSYFWQLKAIDTLPWCNRLNSVSERTCHRLAFNVSVVIYRIYIPLNFVRRVFFIFFKT